MTDRLGNGIAPYDTVADECKGCGVICDPETGWCADCAPELHDSP